MQHLYCLDNINLKKSWVTIGSFDGVHLGHQEIIRDLVQQAHQNHALAVVVTFFPHPAVILSGIDTPFYLTSPEEQAVILAKIGVDHLLTLRFDQNFSQISARDFLADLKHGFDMQMLWIGTDFTLGKNREGIPKTIKLMGKEIGFDVKTIQPLLNNNKKISSTQIRKLILAGNVRGAKKLLGRHYSVSGKVVSGESRGRTLGFPTANLEFSINRLLPKAGVYASRTTLDNQVYQSVTNVGYNPTFEKKLKLPRVETYILGLNKAIYDHTIQVEFIEFIRSEVPFDSVETLKAQIKSDINKSIEVLSNEE